VGGRQGAEARQNTCSGRWERKGQEAEEKGAGNGSFKLRT